MTYEHNTVNRLYKKLLRLYPRAFQERLGESMLQAFNDLYKEHRTKRTWLGFVLWIFTETGMGIFREHALLMTEGVTMKTMLATPGLAPVISFVLFVLPFMILEWATRSNAPRSDASPVLWVVLWLLSTIFIAILMTIMRDLWQAGKDFMAHPVFLLFRLVFLVLFTWLWAALVIDQMPCFLGGSGC